MASVEDRSAGQTEEVTLRGRKIYAFGDSIVEGHNDKPHAFINQIAEKEGMNLTKYAVNGATVMTVDGVKEDPSELANGNYIIKQVMNASSEKPDVIMFNGYTNDAYAENADKLGVICGKDAAEFDSATFCGGFEYIIYTIKKKWPEVPIVYVTAHKSGARGWDVQCRLRELALEMCAEWGVSVADVFNDASLDTRDAAQMSKYIIGGNGSHPNEAGRREFYIPIVTKALRSVF